jgi:hypothetical protein
MHPRSTPDPTDAIGCNTRSMPLSMPSAVLV